MKTIKIEMTQGELVLASTLMSDQLFRREFIDPKMPGYKGDPTELAMGKDLVLRLKSVIRQAADSPVQSVTAFAHDSELQYGANLGGAIFWAVWPADGVLGNDSATAWGFRPS